MNRPDESLKNSILIYTTEDGLTKIDTAFDGDTVWLLHADQRLNALISSDQRATLISVDSMAYSMPWAISSGRRVPGLPCWAS